MENTTEFINIIFITLFIILDIIKGFLPSVDIISGITILVLSLGVVFLVMKLIEKEIIFKSFLLFLLFVSFFIFIRNLEIIDEVTFYLSSLSLGIIFLLASSAFISWDEDSEYCV